MNTWEIQWTLCINGLPSSSSSSSKKESGEAEDNKYFVHSNGTKIVSEIVRVKQHCYCLPENVRKHSSRREFCFGCAWEIVSVLGPPILTVCFRCLFHESTLHQVSIFYCSFQCRTKNWDSLQAEDKKKTFNVQMLEIVMDVEESSKKL